MLFGTRGGCFPRSHMRVVVLVVVAVMIATLPSSTPPVAAQSDGDILRVGATADLLTRSPIRVLDVDVWTRNILEPVYDHPIRRLPDGTQQPYIAKGVDFDEDGVFETAEYGVWAKEPTKDPLNVTAYYDFNGVRWHDGHQVSVWDLLFSYHINAMYSSFAGIVPTSVLFTTDSAGLWGPRGYEFGGRQLNVSIAPKDWEGEENLLGDPSLRVAVRFGLRETFSRFYEATLFPMLLPMHIWSRTGGGRHTDFGCAIWIPPDEAAAKGIPECGTPDEFRWGGGVVPSEPVTGSKPYSRFDAVWWEPKDEDVIGSGPFRFVRSTRGVRTDLARYDGYFVGDPYDSSVSKILHLPRISGIQFNHFGAQQIAMFALRAGQVDLLLRADPGLVVDLLVSTPGVVVQWNADPGFQSLVYNVRTAPSGYEDNNPTRDVGFVLRQAVSHLVDKSSLQSFGFVAHGFIPPSNSFWYNSEIPKPQFNLTRARDILDSPEARTVGISEDPPGACSQETPSGCRSLPRIERNPFRVLTVQPEYDPAQWAPAAMIVAAMREIGLNAVLDARSISPFLLAVFARDFDAYVGRRSVTDADPDYLFEIFHSSRNALGLNNATLDATLEASRQEVDRVVRRQHILETQAILAALRPEEPLLHPTNVEAYRADRFVNWTKDTGTIWNYWSLLGIQPPKLMGMRLTVPSAMRSADTEFMTVVVFEPDGDPVVGGAVTISANGGNLTLEGTVGSTVTGLTDDSGWLRAAFAAPSVSAETLVLLNVDVALPGIGVQEARTTTIRIFPLEVWFLSVTADLPFGDLVAPGGTLPLIIAVHDQDGIDVGDAEVSVTTSNLMKLRPSKGEGTSAEMSSVFVEADEQVVDEMTIAMTVRAAKPGFVDGERTVSVQILPAKETPPPVPGFSPYLVMAGVALVLAATGLILAAWVWRRNRRR